jgi:hypothetical protein
VRAFAPDAVEKHGFISSQRKGMDVFMNIDPRARLVFATAAWQHSDHVLSGLRTYRGLILTVANWSGTWPGLVGLLNLNRSLTKAGVPYSSIWSEDFTDQYAIDKIDQRLRTGAIEQDTSHVWEFSLDHCLEETVNLGTALARSLQHRKAILGIFDEGCMGMYNAIIDDELLNPIHLGVPDFWCGTSEPLFRRLRGSCKRAPTGDVVPFGRRFIEGSFASRARSFGAGSS